MEKDEKKTSEKFFNLLDSTQSKGDSNKSSNHTNRSQVRNHNFEKGRKETKINRVTTVEGPADGTTDFEKKFEYCNNSNHWKNKGNHGRTIKHVVRSNVRREDVSSLKLASVENKRNGRKETNLLCGRNNSDHNMRFVTDNKSSDDGNLDPNRPSQSTITVNPCKMMGYKFLESLLNRDSGFILTTLASPKSGFKELLNNHPLRADLLILITSILHKVKDSEIHQLKVQVLSEVFSPEFIDDIKKFLGLICIEDKPERLKSIESFFINVLSLFEMLIDLFPSMMNERLRSVVVALNMSMKNAKELQGVTVMDCLFQQGKTVIEQIDSYIDNKNKDDGRKPKAPGDKCVAPNDFRELPLIPTKDDFLCAKPFLRQNVVKGSYNDVEQYLDIQFRLLREDFIAPLRTGIYEYVEKLSTPHLKHKYTNVNIYPKIQFKQPFKSRDTFGFLINFDCDKKMPRYINWEYSKRFMVGSLLLFSDDHFQTFYLATVVEREIKQLQQGHLCVAFVPGSSTPEYIFEPDVFFVMAESQVYYEAYRPVLSALKRLNESNFPMKQYIVDVDMACLPPVYVVDEPVYKISGYNVNLLEENSWPSSDKLKLNPSQHQAFKSALTNDFVVIQGPPGTGKTYLALKITEVMLKNQVSEGIPIVVICYTNHALDQFLEGILKYTDNLIRIGSLSQNETLQKYNLDEIRKVKRSNRTLNFSSLYRETISEKIFLQENIENMKTSVDEINSPRGIFDLKVLKSVIPPQLYNELNGYEVDWLLCVDSPDLLIPKEELMEIPTEGEVLPGETVQNVTDFEVGEEFEEDVSDDENACRLADLLDDDFFEDNLQVRARSLNCVSYILVIEDLKHEIMHLQIQHKNEYRRFMSTIQFESEQDIDKFYSKQDILLHRIDEMKWQVTLIERLLIKFKNFKFDSKTSKILQNTDTVWNMDINERWNCFMSWMHLYSCQLKQGIQYMTNQYQDVLIKLNELKQLEDLTLVRGAAVIGLTTSGAAKRRVLLENLGTKIVIVEEAAEVLEAHIVTSLTKSVQHLILIGDHKQLKPKPAVYQLAKKFNMEVSLFERMLKNGLGCTVLEEQHRMRPEIASLIVPTIYPFLANHPSTFNRSRISGVDKFVFFLTHNHPEDQLPDSSSKQNKYEADFLIALCQYLLLQGYSPEDITILATYTGQVWCLRKEKRKLAVNNPEWKRIRITPVDNFQGEENRIILLSLVRSNKENRIGFLNEENRVCVALSRAKEGLYVVGNMDNLMASSAIWPRIKQRFDEIGGIGESLTLRCERHPSQLIQVSTAQHFSKVPEGGCLLKCETFLECGHICSRICHIIDSNHTEYKCFQPCQRLPCTVEGHKCPLHCWKPCEPCVITMSRQLPCGHSTQLPCHVEPASVKCLELVPTVLPDCGHLVQKNCYKDIEFTSCSERCTIRLPCGHACTRSCHVNDDPDHIKYKCMKECTKTNVRCRQNHTCSKFCYEVCGDCEVRLLVRLPCGHSENILCSQDETTVRCQKPCTKALPCGHKCTLQCWMSCDPKRCIGQVNKVGACGHTFKKIKCNEDTESLKCFEKCNRLKSCGHPCTGKCLTDCSKVICQVRVEIKVVPSCGHFPIQVPCHLNTSDIHPGSDRILQLCERPCRVQLLCGHVCSGICGKCMQGRLHISCSERCNKKLNCGHMCKAQCSVLCPPCQFKGCFSICNHSKCEKNCRKICDPCTKRCVWQCEHEKCTKQCGEECNRLPCDKPCTFELKCGHMCVGYCGEVHPQLCRICDDEHPIISGSPQSRFVVLEDCNHVIEGRQLQELIDVATRGGVVRLLECPQCSHPIVKTMRCRSIYIQFRKHLIKMNQLVYEEHFRLKKIVDSHRELLQSDPTISTTMNNLMSQCCQKSKLDSRGLIVVLVGCLLQPLATKMLEVQSVLTVEDIRSLRIRLDYLAQVLYRKLSAMNFEDILQIELEVAHVLRILECRRKYVGQTILNWFDTGIYTWNQDTIIMRNYGLQPITRTSVTLRTRAATKLWFQCDKEHLYVSENGEPCVTCTEENAKQKNENADLIRHQISRRIVAIGSTRYPHYRGSRNRRRY